MTYETDMSSHGNTVTLWYEGDMAKLRGQAVEMLETPDLDLLCQNLEEGVEEYLAREGKPVPDPLAVIIEVADDPLALWEELDGYREPGAVARRLKKIGGGIMDFFGYLGAARLGYPYEGDPGMED